MKKIIVILMTLCLMLSVALADPYPLENGTMLTDERATIYLIRDEAGVVASVDPILNDQLTLAIVVEEEITDQMMIDAAEEVFSSACRQIDAEVESLTVLDVDVEQGKTLTWTLKAVVIRKEPRMGSIDVMKDVVPEKETEEEIVIRVDVDDYTLEKEYVSIAASGAEELLKRVIERQ